MKDGSKLGVREAPALIATVFMLAGGARLAQADEPAPPAAEANELTGAAWFARPRLALTAGEASTGASSCASSAFWKWTT
jgi:hypothetical protein